MPKFPCTPGLKGSVHNVWAQRLGEGEARGGEGEARGGEGLTLVYT